MEYNNVYTDIYQKKYANTDFWQFTVMTEINMTVMASYLSHRIGLSACLLISWVGKLAICFGMLFIWCVLPEQFLKGDTLSVVF